MVRCHICGTEVLAGWVCGIPPANDAQKLGLCPEHNTVENRALVHKEWSEMMRRTAGRILASTEDKAEPVVEYELRIHFLGGGVKVLRCSSYEPNQDQELLVVTREGGLEFYPLRHIRHFSVSEVMPGIVS